MKKLIVVFICSVLFSSCSVESDPNTEFYYEILPIDHVDIPSEFVFGETYEIFVGYLRPSGCHIFNDFYYTSENNQRTIAVINTVYSNQNCEVFDNVMVEVSFNFVVTSNDSYVFRFWQGEDDNGNDIYYIVEVPVI